jgi:hypothetical protein
MGEFNYNRRSEAGKSERVRVLGQDESRPALPTPANIQRRPLREVTMEPIKSAGEITRETGERFA